MFHISYCPRHSKACLMPVHTVSEGCYLPTNTPPPSCPFVALQYMRHWKVDGQYTKNWLVNWNAFESWPKRMLSGMQWRELFVFSPPFSISNLLAVLSGHASPQLPFSDSGMIDVLCARGWKASVCHPSAYSASALSHGAVRILSSFNALTFH